jgi:cytochrome c oxidase assembly protein subunit 15
VPRWLHWWAVLTACCAVPLVLLGAEVTTKQVGMVDRQGFRPPSYLLAVLLNDPLREVGLGHVIEYSHRLFGFLVGLCSIVLALGLSLGTRRPVVRWLGWVALAAVSAQGLLGIFRVNLDLLLGPHLALVHGLFAQLVFATLVGVAVVTSRTWLEAPAVREGPRLRRLSLLVVVLLYAQIVFGAVVRHLQDRLAQRLHVLFAFVVLAAVLVLVQRLWQRGPELTAARRWAAGLVVLLVLQLLLGVEAWMGRFGSGVAVEELRPTPALDLVRTGHFVIGTLLFSTAVVVSLLLHRGRAAALRPGVVA